MNEDMPWVNLTQEEVEELRNKKHELTEYGKQKLRKLMSNEQTVTVELTQADMETLLECVHAVYSSNDEYYEKNDELQESVKNVGNKILNSYRNNFTDL
jgi:PP-loop superfamily ATP-utilizing enzyme